LYYRLQKFCHLVEGANRGAIYDLQTGKVFSINKGAVRLLHKCQDQALNNLLDTSSPECKPFITFLDQLSLMGLGSLYINAPADTPQIPEPDEPPKLDFLWLELTSRCNNKCLHCYATSSPCTDGDSVTHDQWLSLITAARSEGATAIQLIGGEPLMYSRWRELVVKASSEGYELIEIFTNATLVNDSCIEFFKKYNVNIATTIYADNATIHDQVTQHQGSFDKTLTAIKKILAAGLPLRVASIIMKINEHEVTKIMELYEQLGIDPIPPDVVRPTGRGDDADLQPVSYARPSIKPPFFTDAHSFQRARKYHTCLAGRLAVTSSGDVIPCIFARNQVCGNIAATPLVDIINGPQLQQCWHTTKDDIEKCKHCEYRYACNDCRPHAQGSDPHKKWLACSKGCAYNPHTGKWDDTCQVQDPKSTHQCPYGKKK